MDATELHRRVDELSAELHRYVETAVGVRSEFDAATADDDPRVEAAESAVERANTAFDTAFEETLGMVCSHTGFADEDDEDTEGDEDSHDSITLELTFDPAPDTSGVRAAIAQAMDDLDEFAHALSARLEARGVTVSHWACIHESYADEDDDDE
ncbi:hypothetical protein GCM10010401_18640 [Rarobacter faecitabidus]